MPCYPPVGAPGFGGGGFASLMGQTVDIVRPGATVDTRNNSIPDWTAATRTTIKCWLQQNSTAEPHTDGRDQADEMWLMISPDNPAVSAKDRVEWSARPEGPITFEVEGPSKPTYRGGFAVPHHWETMLRCVEIVP